MGIPCFLLTKTETQRVWLRRYSQFDRQCPGAMSYHDSLFLLGDFPEDSPIPDTPPPDDERWPKACACGYQFTSGDIYQVFTLHLFRREDNGQMTTIRESPPGAMWLADWFPQKFEWENGGDSPCLIVKTPGGDWNVDSRASNCTMKDDRKHRCWIRHGDPPKVTVDKNGFTCQAGAGSIQAGNWHGFLRNGELVN